MRPERVLFTGGRAPVTLDLVRLFAQRGHEVYVAESFALHLCRYSRAVTRSFLVPPPKQDLAGFREALVQIVETHEIDLVVPTCEEVFFVSQVMKDLPCRVFADAIDKLRALHSKADFIALAAEHGLPVPPTRVVDQFEAVRAVVESGEDIVLKREFSRFSCGTVVLPKTLDDLAGVDVSSKVRWVIQRYLGPRQYCTYSVVHGGRMVAHTMYPTTHTAGPGSSIYFRSQSKSQVERWVEKFVGAIHYTGQISFDFIKAGDGTFYPIECNPRATSGIHLFRHEDDLASSFWDDRRSMVRPLPERRVMVTAAMWLYALPSALRAGNLGGWLRDLLAARDAGWSWRDPVPFLLQWQTLLSFYALARAHGVSLLAATTLDIEWDGALPETPGADSSLDQPDDSAQGGGLP